MIQITIGIVAFLVLISLFFLWQKWKWRALLAEEKFQFAKKNEEELREAFKALSYDALDSNSRSFLELAQLSLAKFQEHAIGDLDKKAEAIEGFVAPVKEALEQLGQGLGKLEMERKGDQAMLKAQVDLLLGAKRDIVKQTATLAQALRAPIARGRWGEIQLRRVVEMAGMLNRCDFYEQVSSEGGGLRPDLLVKLPGGRQVIVDAKVPLGPYLDGIEQGDEAMREVKFKEHARVVRSHLHALAKKSYQDAFSPSPEFVILFLPSEALFSAALQYDPALIESGADQGVILATPTTLIALLKGVSYGWKQENLSQHAEQVSKLGHELYKRLIDMSAHFSKMGRSLTAAVESYNKGIGSLESRVLVSARRLKELGAASQEEIDLLEPVDSSPREGGSIS